MVNAMRHYPLALDPVLEAGSSYFERLRREGGV
jgi:hypothetical protein